MAAFDKRHIPRSHSFRVSAKEEHSVEDAETIRSAFDERAVIHTTCRNSCKRFGDFDLKDEECPGQSEKFQRTAEFTGSKSELKRRRNLQL